MLGTLLGGAAVSQCGVGISPVVKTVFFDLFLFATGYKVGPQLFRGLRKDALPQLALTVVICVASLVTAVSLSRLLDYDAGTSSSSCERDLLTRNRMRPGTPKPATISCRLADVSGENAGNA